jgi:hypothetical protein
MHAMDTTTLVPHAVRCGSCNASYEDSACGDASANSTLRLGLGILRQDLKSLDLRPLDVGGLQMAQTLEALGLMMIGLAKNGAGTWDFALNVDFKAVGDGRIGQR